MAAAINDTVDSPLNHSMDFRTEVTVSSNDIVALGIDDFPLLTHHVIILQDLFPRIVVISFDTLLSCLYLTGQHARLDNRIFVTKVHSIQEGFNALWAKATHKLIFQWQVELWLTWITLTAWTSAQLIVNPAAFMALCTDNAETAQFANAFTQLDVGSPSGHIGRNSNRTTLAGVHDNLCFFIVVFRIKNFVRNPSFYQFLRNIITGFNCDSTD